MWKRSTTVFEVLLITAGLLDCPSMTRCAGGLTSETLIGPALLFSGHPVGGGAAPAVTVPVGNEVTACESLPSVAVTATRNVCPTSSAARTYVVFVAPVIALQVTPV